jgi:hypothetical protein
VTDEECIRSFFEELDRRIRGVSEHSHPRESRIRLAALRPILQRRADRDPAGFAADMRAGHDLIATRTFTR